LKSYSKGPIRIGLFDGGAAGYFAGWYPNVTIVNLDGLVNNVAIDSLDQGRYPEYVAANVDVFLQSPRRTMIFLDAAQYAHLLDLLERRGMNVTKFR
jgi:hypothetical protein